MNTLDALNFILAGFAVVLGALALLWLVSALVGRVFAAAAPSQRAARAHAVPAPAPADIPPAHLAAISAAVAVLTAGHGRVVSVHAPAPHSAAWRSAQDTAPQSVRWGRPADPAPDRQRTP